MASGGFQLGAVSAIKALQSLSTAAATAQGKLAQLASSMKLFAGGAAITGIGFVLADGLSKAADSGAKLQTTLVGIQQATGASKAQMDALQTSFVTTGLRNQMSVTDAAKVALAAVHAGITDPKQLLATAGTLSNYAEVQNLANHTDRGAAATQGVEYAHLFGAYSSNLLNPLVNVLSKALTHTPLTGAGFNALVSQYAGATRSVYGTGLHDRLRLQSDDTLMGVLLGQLGQGTRGGTQFSSALMRMATATGGAALAGRNYLERMGHGKFFGKDGKFLGDENMLHILSVAAKNIGDPSKLARVNKAAFGMVGARLMGLLEDPVTLQRWMQNQTTFNRIPDLATQQQAYNATYQGQKQQLSKNLSTIVTLLGQQLIPYLVSFTHGLVEVTKTIALFMATHKGIVQFIAIFALVTTTIALIVGPFLMLVGLAGMLSIAFGAITVALSPVILIALGVVAAITAVVLIIMNWGRIMKFVGGLFSALGTGIHGLLKLLGLVHDGGTKSTYVAPKGYTDTGAAVGGQHIIRHTGGGGLVVHLHQQFNGVDHQTAARFADHVVKKTVAAIGGGVEHHTNHAPLNHRPILHPGY